MISRAEQPALALLDGEVLVVDPPRLEEADHHGAGDSMTAGVAAMLAQGGDLREAVRTGAAAGALNVTRHGLGTGQRRGHRGGHRPRRVVATIGKDHMTMLLITNDDGIDAPGIRARPRRAARRARRGGRRAGQGGQRQQRVHLGGGGGRRSWCEQRELPGRTCRRTRSPPHQLHRDARPARGVRRPAEVVLSGMNRGANAGTAVLHSGTVGAALTARRRLRGLAVSLDVLTPGAAAAASGGAAIADLDQWTTRSGTGRPRPSWPSACCPR